MSQTRISIDQFINQTNPQGSADTLAARLTAQPGSIPDLVAQAKRRPCSGAIGVLRDAIGEAAYLIKGRRERVSVCLAMAELALLIGDDDDARWWAHRGLRLDAYNASLALVLSKVEDDLSVGEPARDVLARVVIRRPRENAVWAALIRRDIVEGEAEQARTRLEDWLAREPASAEAQGLVQDLAA